MGFLGEQYTQTERALSDVLKAKSPWGRIVPEIRENFAWDFEEATVLDIMMNKESFYSEIKHYLVLNYDIKDDIIEQLIDYQKNAILNPDLSYPQYRKYSYNIHNVIHKKEDLEKKDSLLKFDGKNYNGDFFEYGKETLWWGRRVAAYKNKITELQNENQS